MHVVTVCLRQSPINVQFFFKDFISANAFRQRIRDAQAKTETEEAVPADAWIKGLRDDFAKEFDLLLEEIASIILADPEEGAKGGIALGMIQARAQAEMQAKAQADPKLRFLAGNMQHPGVIT